MKLLSAQIFVISTLLGMMSTTSAQAPDTLWTKTFGGSDVDFGNAVRQTSDGGFVVAGQIGTVTGAIDSGDVWLLRTDAGGDTLWTKIFVRAGRNAGNAVQQTSDGGYIVAGYTTSVGGANRDLWLIRTDAEGDTAWTRTFGGSSTDEANGVQQTSDGGFVVTGTTRSFGAGGTDVWLIRTDANGDTLWTRTYGGAGSEAGIAGLETSDGGLVVTGSFFSLATGASDLWLLRTDAAGDTLWTKTYNGPYHLSSLDAGRAIKQTSDGGFIIAGETKGPPNTISSDMWLLRTDASGDTLWTRTFGGPSTDRGNDVCQTSDGGFAIAGFSLASASNIDALVIRTDAAGDSLWSSTFGDDGNDQFTSISETMDGGLIIAGFTSSSGMGGNDAWLVRLDSDAPTAIESREVRMPDRIELLQNYPNPFNPSTRISYSITKPAHVDLAVFNTLGQVVRTLVGEYQPAGEYVVTWDGHNDAGRMQSTGLYFYRLNAGNIGKTRRMLLLR